MLNSLPNPVVQWLACPLVQQHCMDSPSFACLDHVGLQRIYKRSSFVTLLNIFCRLPTTVDDVSFVLYCSFENFRSFSAGSRDQQQQQQQQQLPLPCAEVEERPERARVARGTPTR